MSDKKNFMSRRQMLKTAMATTSAIAAGGLALAQSSKKFSNVGLAAVKQKYPGEPRFRGPFPILSTPYTDSGAVDYEILVREARFADWCGSPGMIWPQSNDSIDLLTTDEKLEGMERLAETARGLRTTALCLGVNGRDTDDLLVYARHAKKLRSTAIISRPPDTGETQDDLRDYYRALASVIKDRPVMIQTTVRKGGANPSVELLIELAKEFPNFGYVKEETTPVIPRMQELLASPSIRRVFGAHGGFGWLYQLRLGIEGLVTERLAYADVLAQIWSLVQSGSDPNRLKDLFSKFLLMINLSITHPGDLRGYSLHLLKMRGVFRNMVSREYGPDGVTPDKPIVKDLKLSDEEIAEVEWRFDSLRPFLKSGVFEG